MASDDMHVVMYKILSYLYACMKNGVRAENERFSAEALGINRMYWSEIVAELAQRGFIRGVTVTTTTAGDSVYIDNARVTMEGVEFLMENSLMAKAKRFIKDCKDFIPSPF